MLRLSHIAAICALGLLPSTSYGALVFTLGGSANTGSDPAEVNFVIEEVGGDLKFTVTSVPESGTGNIGDLRAVFFDVADESLLSGLSVTGADVTGSEFNADSVNNLGNGANINGSGVSFDAGVKIGSAGIGGGDDIQTTMFVLSHSSVDLSMALLSEQMFGVRLTSTGVGLDRGGSSKLIGEGPNFDPVTNPVPEPSSFAMLGVLGACAGLGYRRNRQKKAAA